MTNNLDKKAWNLAGRVRKEAEELDKLANGALVAVLGGTVALGILFGGAWWALAAASGSLIAYRGVIAYLKYMHAGFSRRIEQQRETLALMQEIEQAQLPLLAKDELTNQLLGDFTGNGQPKSLPVPAYHEQPKS